MFSLVILILANDANAYIEMQKIWKSYMNNHPNIKSYFIKYKGDLVEDVVLIDDTIFIKGYESLIPGCLDKTIKSIDFILKNTNVDFIFRTNMSSVVDINKFYCLLNETIQCAGVIGFCGEKKFVSGAGILMNKKTCQLLIENKNTLNYSVLDDVSIGDFLTNKNINIIPLTRFEAYSYANNINLITKDDLTNFYHIRCKSETNSNKTIEIMRKITQLIYA